MYCRHRAACRPAVCVQGDERDALVRPLRVENCDGITCPAAVLCVAGHALGEMAGYVNYPCPACRCRVVPQQPVGIIRVLCRIVVG